MIRCCIFFPAGPIPSVPVIKEPLWSLTMTAQLKEEKCQEASVFILREWSRRPVVVSNFWRREALTKVVVLIMFKIIGFIHPLQSTCCQISLYQKLTHKYTNHALLIKCARRRLFLLSWPWHYNKCGHYRRFSSSLGFLIYHELTNQCWRFHHIYKPHGVMAEYVNYTHKIFKLRNPLSTMRTTGITYIN